MTPFLVPDNLRLTYTVSSNNCIKGTRWYILAKWKAFKTFQLSAKLSITYHSSVSEWGSGLEKIQGNIEKGFGLEGNLEL